ncbi:hypothetical protein [Branchiibius cervicis]|uniref:Uncharacterized protein n=1 Tax=Branchiibius cervicis TaxID=908252 RepID=A0ABW2ATW9_9MICO
MREPVTLLLAADLPFVAAAIEPLQTALQPDDDAVALADRAGRINFLAAAWWTRRLRAAVWALADPADRPMRALGIPRAVPDPAGWGMIAIPLNSWRRPGSGRERNTRDPGSAGMVR